MMRARASRQRGIALVLVVWVAVLLLVVASSFILERRSETLVIRNSASMARAAAIADAGVNRAIWELYRIGNLADQWKRDGAPHDWTFDGAAVRVEIRDESAKIDINSAADLLLRGLFLSVGVADDEAVKLVDAVLDWRDADSLRRPNGAEEPEYRAAGLPYKPANAPFQAIEEIQLVLGMRPDIYRRIAPLITVVLAPGVREHGARVARGAAGHPRRDAGARGRLHRAPRSRALAGLAVPAVPAGHCLHLGRDRAGLDSLGGAPRDGTVFTREAVAVMRPTPFRPVSYVAWRESTAAPTDDAAAAPGASGTPPAGMNK